jgi:tetratricopeptide (TPR) repeat protein
LGKLWASRDHNQARDYFEVALELARRIDDPAFLAVSLNWMGNWHANDEIPIRAMEYHQEALNIFEDLGAQQDLANTLDLLGIASLLAGDLNTSVQYYNRAIELFREFDDRPRLTSGLMGRATTVSMLVFLASVSATPSPDAAFDFNEALRVAREIDSAPDEAWAHWSLGLLHTVHGHFGRALKVLQNGLRIASEIGHREWVVCNRFALGILYAELFTPDQAWGQLKEALTLTGELRSPHYIHLVSAAITGAYLMADELESAQVCLEKAISPQTPMDTLGKRYCWVRRAELALAQDDPALALDITDSLITSAPGMSPGCVITFLWKLKAEALAIMRRKEDALSLLHAAVENASSTGERFLLWRLYASLGQLYHNMGNQEAAEKEFSTARALIDELAATVPDEALKKGFRKGARSLLTAPY